MKPILEIKQLSKKFEIYDGKTANVSFRDAITNILKGKGSKSDFWALKDVDFSVNEGETIGVIGKNGAGKSTLLKILSRITPPTEGSIISRGRIASLLEVGTGFHSELTGRENVLMNGSILGMKRHEIRRNFDDIVDFAGVSQFIDTPIKHYSSGMQLRLAFAVAAFLENEILIVDEVLAVGDAEFQKKCMGKMNDVSKSGRTILFVSHNMSAVKQLCTRGIILNQGKLIYDSPIQEAIEFYNSSDVSVQRTGIFDATADPSKKMQIIAGRMLNNEGVACDTFSISEPFQIELTLQVNEPVRNTYGYIVLKNDFEEFTVESDTKDVPPNVLDNLEPGTHTFRIKVREHLLAHGRHRVNVALASPFEAGHLDNPEDILAFHITDFETARGIKRTAKTSFLLNWEK